MLSPEGALSLVATRLLTWSGPKGGRISVGFDDDYFCLAQMREEIDSVREAYPNLPDEVPPGTRFVFAKESTGYLLARFKVGHTVYRNSSQSSLRRLWEVVGFIERLLHPARYKLVP